MKNLKWPNLELKPINLWSLNMVARNDITGDLIKSKATMGKGFEDNFKRIFGEKKKEKYIPPPLPLNEYPDNSSDEMESDN